MCSIIGSYDIDDIKMLAALNAYRGQHSHSIAVFDDDGTLLLLKRGLGPLNVDELDGYPSGYMICHQQAPTTDAKDVNSIHPAEFEENMLWHNGIIKNNQIKKWQSEHQDDQPWDTMWLNRLVTENGFDILSHADGTFACVYYNHPSLYAFRNANSPMFKRGCTISSTRFDGSQSMNHGLIYQLTNKEWVPTEHTFATKEQFFWTPSS